MRKVFKSLGSTKIVIDTIRVRMSLDKVPNDVREQRRNDLHMFGLVFRPVVKETHVQYQSKLKNLFLTLDYDKLKLTNSIHVFNKADNSSEFKYSELYDTITELDDILEGNFVSGNLTKVAIGALLTDVNTDHWSYYKHKVFTPMYAPRSSKVYGRKVKFTDYSIKAYDKTYEQKQHYSNECRAELVRIEKEVIHMRHYRKRANSIPIFKVSDLLNKQKLRQMINDLTYSIERIETRRRLNLIGLKTNELKVIGIMENPVLREHMRRYNKESFRKNKTQYKNLVKRTQIAEVNNLSIANAMKLNLMNLLES